MISVVEHLALHGIGVVVAELVHGVVAAFDALAVPSRQKSTTTIEKKMNIVERQHMLKHIVTLAPKSAVHPTRRTTLFTSSTHVFG